MPVRLFVFKNLVCDFKVRREWKGNLALIHFPILRTRLRPANVLRVCHTVFVFHCKCVCYFRKVYNCTVVDDEDEKKVAVVQVWLLLLVDGSESVDKRAPSIFATLGNFP